MIAESWTRRHFHALGLFFLLHTLISCSAFDFPSEVREALLKFEENSQPTTARLDYNIFRGRSSIRSLPWREKEWIEKYGKSVSSLLLFITNYRDAAHEMILGVTPMNVDNAEYAATHPGSGWTERHPLSTVDDWIHSIIHRDGEGDFCGEGNHTGWDNAMYWAAGGPKRLPDQDQHHQNGMSSPSLSTPLPHQTAPLPPPICLHPVAQRLALEAPQCAPLCCSEGQVVPSSWASHVVHDGTQSRTVVIPPGYWDPFAYIKLRRDAPLEWRQEVERLQQLEYRLLLEYCLKTKVS